MRTSFDRAVGRAVYALLTAAGQHPRIALPLARLAGYGVPIDRRTDVVIEGYPRSGNSFAVAAFGMAQDRSVKIAHHVHAPAQLLLAARRGIPAIVLIDAPERAVVELALARPTIGVAGALPGYVRFYDPLVPHLPRLVVSTTSRLMSDFGSVIRRVNERFGTNFNEFRHTDQNVGAARERARGEYETRRRSTGPVAGTTVPDRDRTDRYRLREMLRKDLENPRLEATLMRARSLFETFSGEAG